MRTFKIAAVLILITSQYGYTKGGASTATKGSASSSYTDQLNKGSTIRETVTPITPDPNAGANAQAHIEAEANYARSLSPTTNGGSSSAAEIPAADARTSVGNMDGLTTTSDSGAGGSGLTLGNSGSGTGLRLGEGNSSGPRLGGQSTAETGKSGVSGVVDAELTAASNQSLVGTKLDCSTLDAEIEKGVQAAPKAMNKPAMNLMQSCQALKAQDESCYSVFNVTKTMCHTEENENIASSVTMIQTLMSVASGVTNACNNFGKAMDIAKKAMALYTTACGAAQVTCNLKCGGAMKALTTFHTNLKATTAAAGSACSAEALSECTSQCSGTSVGMTLCINSCTEPKYAGCSAALKASSAAQATFTPELQPTGTSIANKVKVCKVSVASLLGTAIINIGSLVQSKAQSDQCKADAAAKEAAETAQNSCTNVANKDRADCACTIAANKTLSYCATGLVDCGLTENADKPLCICKANPRMSGCEGVSTSIATNSALNNGSGSGLTTGKGKGNLSTTPTTAADATNLFPNNKGNGQDGTGSSSGAGGASGAGLSADASGSGATDKTTAAAAPSKDSANVLDSGGGGGGGYRGMASTYSSPEYRSRLKAFADKNGIGSKIAGSSWGDQVTATGGKSNFDKVKTRYQENKSTLLSK